MSDFSNCEFQCKWNKTVEQGRVGGMGEYRWQVHSKFFSAQRHIWTLKVGRLLPLMVFPQDIPIAILNLELFLSPTPELDIRPALSSCSLCLINKSKSPPNIVHIVLLGVRPRASLAHTFSTSPLILPLPAPPSNQEARVTQTKAFGCGNCQASFSNKSARTKHTNRHHRTAPYELKYNHGQSSQCEYVQGPI